MSGGIAMDLCVIGVGYVGLTTSVGLASLGNRVIAVDSDLPKIADLRSGKINIYEPGLTEILKENLKKRRLVFTDSLEQGVREAAVIFITVGTPSRSDGSVDLDQIMAVTAGIGKYLDSYKVVVLKSTVPVGTGRCVLQRLVAAQVNPVEFDLVANPEFLREGTAVHDFYHPDRIVIGGDHLRALETMKTLYRPFQAPVLTISLETAELIKYAANAFLATKVSFINEMANLCDELKVNIKDVARGIGLDSRIGPEYLNAGIGYGGSCLPKDVSALLKIGENVNYHLALLDAVRQVNRKQVEHFVGRVRERLSNIAVLETTRVAVWGISFKPDTDDLREAPSLAIITRLAAVGVALKVYDPVGLGKLGSAITGVTLAADPYQAATASDALLILTEWPQFLELDWLRVKSSVRHPIIFDGRNCLDPRQLREYGFEYYGIGGGVVEK
jgi:UDPglucose 6-dehydrogenase